jgi:hypothetical protein
MFLVLCIVFIGTKKSDRKTLSFSCQYKIFQPMFDAVTTINKLHSAFPLSTLHNLTCDFMQNPILNDRIKLGYYYNILVSNITHATLEKATAA